MEAGVAQLVSGTHSRSEAAELMGVILTSVGLGSVSSISVSSISVELGSARGFFFPRQMGQPHQVNQQIDSLTLQASPHQNLSRSGLHDLRYDLP